MTAKEHNRTLSILFFVQGGLQLFGGILLAVIYGGIGTMMLSTSHRDEEQMMGGIFLVVGVVVGLIVLVFAAFDIFAASKLLKELSIGRTLGIIVSCLSLMSFPLGTALGIYGLWFLFGDLGKNFYAGVDSSGGQRYTPPPPPNSWQ